MILKKAHSLLSDKRKWHYGTGLAVDERGGSVSVLSGEARRWTLAGALLYAQESGVKAPQTVNREAYLGWVKEAFTELSNIHAVLLRGIPFSFTWPTKANGSRAQPCLFVFNARSTYAEVMSLLSDAVRRVENR